MGPSAAARSNPSERQDHSRQIDRGDRALTIDPSDLERIAPLAGFKPSKGGEYYAIAKTIGLNVDYGLTEPKKLYVTSRTASPRLVIYVGLVMSSTYAAAIHQGA